MAIPALIANAIEGSFDAANASPESQGFVAFTYAGRRMKAHCRIARRGDGVIEHVAIRLVLKDP